MRLTVSIRLGFVRGAMQDVPKSKIPYVEQAEKLAVEDSIAQLPAELQKVARDNSKKHYLNMEMYYFPDTAFQGCYVFSQKGFRFKPCDSTRAKIVALDEQRKAETLKLESLREKLAAAANSCTTVKQLRLLLPEFAQYLPSEIETARNLPAVTNLVADFTAAGWPKGKAPTLTVVTA
jgi:hypothetical protein